MSPLPLDSAAAELHAAAVLAETRAADDPFSPWTALAAQLRLVAAGLAPASVTHAPHRPLAMTHVAAALKHLEHPNPGPGVENLDFWRRHVEHLHGQVARLETPTSRPRGTS